MELLTFETRDKIEKIEQELTNAYYDIMAASIEEYENKHFDIDSMKNRVNDILTVLKYEIMGLRGLDIDEAKYCKLNFKIVCSLDDAMEKSLISFYIYVIKECKRTATIRIRKDYSGFFKKAGNNRILDDYEE